MVVAPWWTFNRIDNFGQIDPQGPYWKPDSNILTPPLYPVASIVSGMVTGIQRTSWGQTVVTVKMDVPYNSVATHFYYEHMHSANVKVGQRVNVGDTLGLANNSGEGANLGVGFYNGDIYGSGPGWNELQKDLCPGCPNLLNPVKFLNAAKGGNIPTGTGTGTGTAVPSIPGVFDFASIAPTLKSWGEYAAIFILALMFVAIGIYLLGGHPLQSVAAPFDYVKSRRDTLRASA